MLSQLINTAYRTTIPLERIKTDGGTQMRAALDPDTVQEYLDAMQPVGWGDFPAVIVYYDGKDHWLADGFHRVEAYRRAAANLDQPASVPADVRVGTRRDAILHAAGANASHGLRRTNADKRRAVETLLRDDDWRHWSDREIARRCNVTAMTVGRIRSELIYNNVTDAPTERTVIRNGTTYTQNTANVGAKPVETDEQRRQRIRDNDRRMKEEINSRFASQTPAFVDAVARAAMQTIYDAIPDGDDDEDYDADAADAATVQVIEFDADEPATESEFIPVSQRDDYDSDEWYTPADYIEAARRVMGSIGLDPATSELAQTVVKADAYLTKFDNGLAHIWLGATVWLNPPYSDTQRWVDKLRAEYAKGIFIEQAIILVNNATETAWFQALLTSHPVCLPSRRLAFWRHDHNNATARQGQAIFYLGPNVETFVSEFAQFGPILRRIDQ